MDIRRDKDGRLISYCHISKDELICAGTVVDGMDFRIEEMLDRYQAHIVTVEWQSRVNYYVKYTYEPFTTEMFLRQFTVDGDIKFLEWLNGKINSYLDNQSLLENCFDKEAMTPIHEITFKID